MARRLLLLLTVFAFAGYAQAGSVNLKSALDRAESRIGEPIRYSLTLIHPRDTTLLSAPTDIPLGDFFLEEFGTETTELDGSQLQTIWWFQISSFETGIIRLPEAVVRYQAPGGAEETVSSRGLAVTIVSQLSEEWQYEDIREAKGLVKIHIWRRLLWALPFLLLIAAGLWWLRRRRAAAAAEPPPPPRPAHEIALEAIARLKEEDLIAQGHWEAYYVRLSNILRVYLQGRFGYHAPRMSTEEFLQTILTASEMSLASHRMLVKAFLEECDRVKFARHQPSMLEAFRAMEVAQRLVVETQPAAQPAEEAAPVS